MEKDTPTDTEQKKAGVAMLKSGKGNCTANNTAKDKGACSQMIKGSVHEKDIMPYVYASNKRASKHMKQKRFELQGRETNA